jgi:hypothetical protein
MATVRHFDASRSSLNKSIYHEKAQSFEEIVIIIHKYSSIVIISLVNDQVQSQ